MNLDKFINKILVSGIYVLIVVIPLIIDTSSFSYKLLFMQLLVGFLLIILSIKFLIRDSKIHFSILLLPVILYFSSVLYSYIISDYKEISIFVLSKKITFLSIFFLIGFTLKSTKELKKLINVWIFTATIVAIYGILQYLGLDFLNLYKDWFRGYYRIFSTIGNPNFLAGYLTITFPFLIGSIFLIKKNSVKTLAFITGLIILICLILTYSRSGYLAFIISILSFVILFFTQKNKRRYLILSIFIIFILIISLSLSFYINPDLKYKLSTLLSRRTARIYIWKGAVEMIKEKSLTGFGLGTFVINFPHYRPKELLHFHPANVAYIKHAHNHFLEVWIEAGLYGIISFMILVFAFLFSSPRDKNKKDYEYNKVLMNISTASSFIGIIFMNLVNVNMHYSVNGMFFWVLTGFIYFFKSGKIRFRKLIPFKFRTIFVILFILSSFVVFKSTINSFPYIRKEMQNFNLVFLDLNHKNTDLSKYKNRIEFKDITPEEHYKLGNFYVRKKDWDIAIKFFNKAIQRDENFIAAYNNLGNSYFYNYMSKKAIQIYKKALKINDSNEEILYNLSLVYFLQGYIKQSVEHIRKVLNINSENYKAKYLFYTLAK